MKILTVSTVRIWRTRLYVLGAKMNILIEMILLSMVSFVKKYFLVHERKVNKKIKFRKNVTV